MRKLVFCFFILLMGTNVFAVELGRLGGGKLSDSGKKSQAFSKIVFFEKNGLRTWECEYGWSCIVDLGNIAPGTSKTIGATVEFGGGDYYWEITDTERFSGSSSDVQMTVDTCIGTVLNNSTCYVEFVYTPSDAGNDGSHWDIFGPSCRLGNPNDCVGNWYYTFEIFGTSVENEPKKECVECGSVIRIDNQSVIESIPVVGTNLSLVYSSQFSPNYLSPFGLNTRRAAFNPNGLTVSIQHFVDVPGRKIFYGHGTSSTLNRNNPFAGPVETVVSDDGTEIYKFNGVGRHLETLNALTGAVKYTFNYDSSFRLTSIVDAFGNTTTFNRNGSGFLTSIVAPFGQTTAVGGNGSGLIASIEDPLGGDYLITYKSGTELVETFTKPGGQVTTFSYDSNGRLTQELSNGGNYWNLSKNNSVSGKPVSITSKLGRVKTAYLFGTASGPYNRVESHPNGAQVSYTEESDGSTIETDPLKSISTTTVDDERLGSLYRRISGQTTTIGTSSKVETFAQSVTWPNGVTPNFYNYNSITETATTAGRTKTRSFNPSTMTWTNTSDEGATSTVKVNSQLQPVEVQVGSETKWMYSYDTNGRLAQISQNGQNTVNLTYNSQGHISNLENALGEDTGFAYDLNGRVTQMTLPDSRVVGFAYDPNGKLTGVTPPGRPQHGFNFNAFELVGAYIPPSIGIGVSKNTIYSYNDDKQLTDITRPDGAQVGFTYDATTGELTTITTPSGNYSRHYSPTTQKLVKSRSPSGLRNDLTHFGPYPQSDAQVRATDDFQFGKVSFAYDGSHRRASRTIQGSASSSTSTINYTYNDDDQPTQVGALAIGYSYPSGRISTTSIGQISDSRGYDSYGNLSTYSAIYSPSGGGTPTTLYSYTLTRDATSRIIGKTETIQGTTNVFEYYYDAAGRLTSVERNNVVTDSFVYDSNSNRTSGKISGSNFTATFDNQDRILTLGTRTYTHNRNGDLTQIQWNTTQQSNFVYDVMGNLEQVTTPTGTVLEYLHDGFDRRAVKKAATVFQWRYIYEDQYKVAALISGTNSIVKEFVYATRVNVPDYMINSVGTYRIITDHLGSPRLVVKTNDGTVAQRMDYSTLGAVGNDTNPNFQPFGFAGGLYDGSTELVRYGARDYDPRATGRWTTKDPIRFAGGDVNLYGYVLNDPINFIDPSGLIHPGIAIPGVIGAGAAIGYCAIFPQACGIPIPEIPDDLGGKCPIPRDKVPLTPPLPDRPPIPLPTDPSRERRIFGPPGLPAVGSYDRLYKDSKPRGVGHEYGSIA